MKEYRLHIGITQGGHRVEGHWTDIPVRGWFIVQQVYRGIVDRLLGKVTPPVTEYRVYIIQYDNVSTRFLTEYRKDLDMCYLGHIPEEIIKAEAELKGTVLPLKEFLHAINTSALDVRDAWVHLEKEEVQDV